ncbi:MAG TPA: acyloxyacyl hydrolase [Tepidisphaeraceae bacterium]|nr:acyloxyacyl hydrolase [Tepidisphaeraceae bacterium]
MKNIFISLSFAVLSMAAIARADDSPAPSTDFPKGTFSLTTEADYGHSFDLSPTRFESGLVGVGYYVWDNFSLNAEAAGFSVQQPGPDSIITEFDLKLRHHLYNSGNFSFFVDAGGGVSYATDRTPFGGTYYNYTIQTGPGVSWKLRQNLFLMGGVRYWHLSNARLEGPTHNPSVNALEGYVGLMFTF